MYIAIGFTGWGRDENPTAALKKALAEADEKDLTELGTYRGVRLIEVTLPDNDTDEDDIIFYQDQRYELTGRAKGRHFDGIGIAEYIHHFNRMMG